MAFKVNAQRVLSAFPKRRSPELTEREEKMLNLLEREYGVEAEDTNQSKPQPTNQLPVTSYQLPSNQPENTVTVHC